MKTKRNDGLKRQTRIMSIILAIMNTILPPGGPFDKAPKDYDMVPRIEKILKAYDPPARFFFMLVCRFVQYSALFSKGNVFTKLPHQKAVAFLEEMEQSRFYYKRGMMMMLKLVTTLSFFDIDEVAQKIGYTHGSCKNNDQSI